MLMGSSPQACWFLTNNNLEQGVYVVMHLQTAYFLFFYLLALVPCAAAQTETVVPTVETITARMAQARTENRVHFRPYSVTRDYKLFGKERVTTKSEVIA